MNELRAQPDGSGLRIAIVASRFNEVAVERLIAGARACLVENGVEDERIDLISVPGAWELPLGAEQAARTGRYAALVVIGCVVRGETAHFDFVAGEAARGLAEVARTRRIPVGFGVLTTETADQAMQRAGGRHGNHGVDAARAALEMANLLRRVGD